MSLDYLYFRAKSNLPQSQDRLVVVMAEHSIFVDAEQLLQALLALGNHKLVYRQLSASSALLSRDGYVKIG